MQSFSKLQLIGVDEMCSHVGCTRDGVQHVGIHKTGLDRKSTNARDRAQYAFVDPGLFLYSNEHCNAFGPEWMANLTLRVFPSTCSRNSNRVMAAFGFGEAP